MAKRSVAEQRDEMVKVLGKELPLTREDLQVLREVTAVVRDLSGVDWLNFRMSVESIDAAMKLETAITKLDRTSTCLAAVGIAVTVTGVVLAVLMGVGILR